MHKGHRSPCRLLLRWRYNIVIGSGRHGRGLDPVQLRCHFVFTTKTSGGVQHGVPRRFVWSCGATSTWLFFPSPHIPHAGPLLHRIASPAFHHLSGESRHIVLPQLSLGISSESSVQASVGTTRQVPYGWRSNSVSYVPSCGTMDEC